MADFVRWHSPRDWIEGSDGQVCGSELMGTMVKGKPGIIKACVQKLIYIYIYLNSDLSLDLNDDERVKREEEWGGAGADNIYTDTCALALVHTLSPSLPLRGTCRRACWWRGHCGWRRGRQPPRDLPPCRNQCSTTR